MRNDKPVIVLAGGRAAELISIGYAQAAPEPARMDFQALASESARHG